MRKHSYILTAAAIALASMAGCATPGVPKPPSLQIPLPVNDLTATRKGTRVVLMWTPPTQASDHVPLRRPTLTRICRVANQFPITGCTEVVKELRASDLASVAAGSQQPEVTFEDALPPSWISPAAEATYALEVVNDKSRSAGLSNQVRISLVPTPPVPSDFGANVTSDGPELHWMSAAGFSASRFAVRIYRRDAGAADYTEVKEIPYSAGRVIFTDPNFEWEKTYEYKIAPITVVQQPGRTAEEIEGDDSPIARVAVRDVFPPATPTGVQAVFSSVGQKPFVDLSWTPNTESDVAGYLVFRRTGQGDAVQITPELVKAPAFRDTAVQPGITYTYSVSSVDLRGNRSSQSTPTSENVPRELR